MGVSSHLVMFALDDRRFGLPLEVVERVVSAVEVTPLPDGPDSLLGVINVEGRLVPVINLRRRCRLPERPVAVADQFIIARTALRPVALPVDWAELVACGGADVVPSEQIGRGFGGVHDVMKRADGLIPIYDVESFLSLDEHEAVERTSAATAGGDA